ncbi:MFS transporter [Tropicimonas marinistellae]|uniref:MFS transporter n=1 Tax=Tropicimonas marinistellae TaxID=1739787 RepID=UPI00082F26A5|nr:MFS transporter [Tropicimonas marinistellae]
MNRILLLSLAIGVVGSNSLALSPLAGSVALSFDGKVPADVLVASAWYGAATAVSAVLLAPHIGRIGARRALLLAMFALSLALVATAGATQLHHINLYQAMAGIAAGVCLPSIYGFAADFSPPGRQNETVGKVLTGWTVSLVVGVSIAAFLADLVHWRVVFLALSCLGLLICLALFRVLPPDGTKADRVDVPSPLDALKVAGIAPVLVSVSAFMVAFYGLYAFVGPHVHDALGKSTTLAGLVSLSYGLGYGAATILDPVIDRFGRRRAGPVIFAALTATYVGLAVAGQSYPTLLASAFFWGVFVHLGMTILVGRLTSISPRNRAAILGLYSGVTYASMFVGTAAFKPIYSAFGLPGATLSAAMCLCLVFIIDRAFSRQWND